MNDQQQQQSIVLKARCFDLQEQNTQLQNVLGRIAKELGASTVDEIVSEVQKLKGEDHAIGSSKGPADKAAD
jgi:hypothetical protein